MKKKLLELKDVNFSVPSQSTPILSHINYDVFEHDFVIVLGSNGSGKSSLLKLIDKRNTGYQNHVLLEGKDIRKYSAKDYSRRVKTLTQNCNDSLFPSLTLYENYRLLCDAKANKYSREFLQEYLMPFNAKLSNKLDQIVDSLSGGEKQTFALALTILNPPDILLLDEHTSALDPKTAELNMQLTHDMVLKNKITCLLTTHNLSIAQQYGNRILVIRQGEIMTRVESGEKHAFTQDQMFQMFY